MSLLIAPIVKNSHILTGIYFIFLKNALDQKVYIPSFYHSVNKGKIVIK